ncbi:MAG: hypothetical protein AAF657_07755 [Acidobacteriota bacterium]
MKTLEACELFHRCLAGTHGDAWRLFIDRHGKALRQTVFQMALRCYLPLRGPDVDEIVQEIYYRLLASRGQQFRGRTDAELWAYLSRMALNLLIDRKRAERASKRRPRQRVPGSSCDAPIVKLDPEERLLGKERRRAFFARCLEVTRLESPGLELRALDMAYFGGWTSAEIARRLEHLSVAQINALVIRLRRHLAKRGIHLPRRVCPPSPSPDPC